MKYFKQDSVPLKEDKPGIGQTSYDEHGNYIEVDAFGNNAVLKQSILSEGITVDSFESEKGLELFWMMSKKKREGYDIHDTAE